MWVFGALPSMQKIRTLSPKATFGREGQEQTRAKETRAARRCLCGFFSLCGATDTHCRKAIVWPLETNASSLPKQALVPEERLLFSYEILWFLQHYWHFRAGFLSSASLASPCMAVKIVFFWLGMLWYTVAKHSLCLTRLILFFVWCYCSYWMELE